MRQPMLVERFMTPIPRTLEIGRTLQEAMQIMNSLQIRHLPITDGGKLVGLVSDREVQVLTALASLDPERTSVDVAMITDPYEVPMGTPLKKVAAEMAEAKVGSAIVVDDQGELAGVFTTVDALRALAAALSSSE